MKVAIIGGLGMLGTELMRFFPHATNIPHDLIAVEKITAPVLDGFDLVINCSAYHDVEECEKHPSRAFEVNYLGAHRLAEVCQHLEIDLVHISTNMVFNGLKWSPYVPSDDPAPLNVYGYSKWMGECAIRDQMERGLKALIVRLGPIYGHAPCRGKGGRSFVSNVIKMAKENKTLSFPLDQTVNPVSAADAAGAIDLMVFRDEDFTGVQHVGSDNTCSWYEFAREVIHTEGIKTEVNPVFSHGPVKRPSNGVLKPSLKMPTWQDSLSRYFKSRSEGA